jgi:diacylglycerol kinase family enzyme
VREVLVLQAVALVVLVAETAEKLRKRKLDALGLALVPRGGAQVVAASCGIDGLHLLDAAHARQVVARRFDLGRRRDQRDRA